MNGNTGFGKNSENTKIAKSYKRKEVVKSHNHSLSEMRWQTEQEEKQEESYDVYKLT